MISDVEELIGNYQKWLRDSTALRELDGWVEVTTPFLDQHNDALQIYVRVDGDVVHLTDDGFTIADLEMSGCKLDSPKRRELLRVAVNGFGISVGNNSALTVSTTRERFAVAKNNLLQAMLAVGDMFYVAEPIVKSLFFEHVQTWLDAHDIRHSPRVPFVGRSGNSHVYDFVIPKSKQQPERLLTTLNRPTKQAAELLVFAWIDTREVRPDNARSIAILNDEEKPVSSAVSETLRAYDIQPLIWNKREQFLEELAA